MSDWQTELREIMEKLPEGLRVKLDGADYIQTPHVNNESNSTNRRIDVVPRSYSGSKFTTRRTHRAPDAIMTKAAADRHVYTGNKTLVDTVINTLVKHQPDASRPVRWVLCDTGARGGNPGETTTVFGLGYFRGKDGTNPRVEQVN